MTAAPDSTAGLVEWAGQRLKEAGVALGQGTAVYRDEAAWLVLWAAGLPLDDPDAVNDMPLSAGRARRARELVERRIRSRLPTAYLTGEAWFAGLAFAVDERVIIPRSHLGEWIVEGFSPWLAPGSVGSALDLCTGSGCIAVALAMAFPEARVDAVDISAQALEVARVNVDRYGLSGRVSLLQGDLFAPVAGRRYDLIVTNPPYVGARAMAALPPEYRSEPRIALEAGDDGLALVRRILAEAPRHLREGGYLALEAGSAAPAVQATWAHLPLTWLASDSEDEHPVLLASHAALLNAAGESSISSP